MEKHSSHCQAIYRAENQHLPALGCPASVRVAAGCLAAEAPCVRWPLPLCHPLEASQTRMCQRAHYRPEATQAALIACFLYDSCISARCTLLIPGSDPQAEAAELLRQCLT